MLSLLVSLVSVIKNIAIFSLLLSYKTGELIIIVLKCLATLTKTVTSQGLYVLKVLSEDFNIFFGDILRHIMNIVIFLGTVFNGILDGLIYSFDAVKTALYGICSGCIHVYNVFNGGIEAMIASVVQTFVFIKRLLLLVGSGVWFAITFIPLSILSIFTLTTQYFSKLMEELQSIIYESISGLFQTLGNIYRFVTDVPIESAFGLMIIACITYVLVNFHMELYGFLQEKTLSLLELARINIQALRRWLMKKELESNSEESSDFEEDISEDRYCIVCQDRFKCVLILPCKHLCVCSECNVRLRNESRPCPICRTVVKKTMKVFV